ncbi:hypothetical protein [Amycolatopsis taiwanensis]|nr:hypothetical protein [Amycolatopsis taiwanensis]
MTFVPLPPGVVTGQLLGNAMIPSQDRADFDREDLFRAATLL